MIYHMYMYAVKLNHWELAQVKRYELTQGHLPSTPNLLQINGFPKLIL